MPSGGLDTGELSSRRPAACLCVVPSTRQSGSLSGSTSPVLSFLARGSPSVSSRRFSLRAVTSTASKSCMTALAKLSFSEWSRGSIDVRRAKDAHKPEEKRRKGIVIEERVKADVARGEDADASRRKWEAAVNDDKLYGSFQLKFERLGIRTVDDVLNNPLAYDGERLADPHEHDYRGDGRIAVVYANEHNTGWPYIYSHAHGGKSYALKRADAA